MTEQGSKAKACADVKRLAVAPIGQLNDPMLLRVPAASLKTLTEYGDKLKKRGVKYPAVATKISFDFTVAYPALTFTPVSFITEAMAQQVREIMTSDVVNQIIGGARAETAPTPQVAAPQVPEAATPRAPAAPNAQATVAVTSPAEAAPPPPKPARKPAAAKANGSAAFATTPATPKPAAQSPQASKVVEVQAGDLEADLARVLSDAGFDD